MVLLIFLYFSILIDVGCYLYYFLPLLALELFSSFASSSPPPICAITYIRLQRVLPAPPTPALSSSWGRASPESSGNLDKGQQLRGPGLPVLQVLQLAGPRAGGPVTCTGPSAPPKPRTSASPRRPRAASPPPQGSSGPRGPPPLALPRGWAGRRAGPRRTWVLSGCPGGGGRAASRRRSPSSTRGQLSWRDMRHPS